MCIQRGMDAKVGSTSAHEVAASDSRQSCERTATRLGKRFRPTKAHATMRRNIQPEAYGI